MDLPKAQAQRYVLTHRRGFSLACLGGVVGVMPVLRSSVGETQPVDSHFPGWSTEWDGRPLRRLRFGDRERAFAAEFPGPAALFDDGERLILLRYTERPTRLLRPMEDCLDQIYSVRSAGMVVDPRGRRWRTVEAAAKLERWTVRERIVSKQGESWARYEPWFWSALLGLTDGPWWSVVTFDQVREP